MTLVFVFLTAVAMATGLFGVAPASAQRAVVGVGSSFVVEPPMARYVADLDAQELTEQIRDWAVLGTVTRLGATPEQAAAATYELPPARLPYLDSLYTFEYGRGRRAYLGARVLLFRDGDDPDAQATIGRLADRVREENGKVPAKVEVYLVWDQRNDGLIRVERAADLTGPELFSPAYGYAEATTDTAPELAAWLARVDDLAFAQVERGHLVVGGRRFAKTRTANVTVEDIAALFQAHEKLGAPRASARKVIRALPPASRKVVESAVALFAADKRYEAYRLVAAQSPSTTRRMELFDAVVASASPARGPGFSLDPEWLPDPDSPGALQLETRLRAFRAHPCDEVDAVISNATALEQAEPDPTRRTSVTRRALQLRAEATDARASLGNAAVCHALEALVPDLDPVIAELAFATRADRGAATADVGSFASHWFVEPTGELDATAMSLGFRMLNYYDSDTQAQCARYEGTAGTGVGMTMFYTDLLMKLWMTTDHGESAPILDVPGFVSEPRIERTRQLLDSIRKNRYTRYWLGPRGNGVSRTQGAGTALRFDHLFTRVYAAGTDRAIPGTEVRPNEIARRAVDSWDHHYDDIADYEQEFHRLNQIMKWSLVTGALIDAGAISYLRDVPVDTSDDFGHWYLANQARLRFTGSLPISQSTVDGKQCLPILESAPLTMGGVARFSGGMFGGVSAATDASIDIVPVVDTAKPLGARKAAAGNLLGDKAGTAVRVAPRRTGAKVVFDRVAGVPTSDHGRAVPLGTPSVVFKAGAKQGSLELVAGEPRHPIGVAGAELDRGRVKLSWQDHAVEDARYGADKRPGTMVEADEAARSGDLLGAATAYERVTGGGPPSAVLKRAREIVVDSAHRRPAAVLRALDAIAVSGDRLPSDVQAMLDDALSAVATPRAAEHVKEALTHGRPLAGPDGTLVAERGSLILTRDIDALPTTAVPVPPVTDLTERGVFLDKNLRVGQEGPTHDLGTQAARWQKRARVRMAELREHPVGPMPDEVLETSTGARFEYVPPQKPPQGPPRMPIVIRQCDDSHSTQQTSDDC